MHAANMSINIMQQTKHYATTTKVKTLPFRLKCLTKIQVPLISVKFNFWSEYINKQTNTYLLLLTQKQILYVYPRIEKESFHRTKLLFKLGYKTETIYYYKLKEAYYFIK